IASLLLELIERSHKNPPIQIYHVFGRALGSCGGLGSSGG
ncbi:ORFL201C, partial [Human betaherpesvirus 5]